MERTESIIELSKALCEFHKKVGKVKKGSDNPFFKSKYADLSDILDIVIGPLSESGLTIVQMPLEDYKLQTVLMHTSGEFISCTYTMKPVDNKPQSIGSCITYQRRYAIGAILCLNIDEDDDGNAASSNNQNVQQQRSYGKKMFDLKLLERSDFFEGLYRSEQAELGKGARFSLRNFIDKYYRIDDNAFNLLCEKYGEYKINNSL